MREQSFIVVQGCIFFIFRWQLNNNNKTSALFVVAVILDSVALAIMRLPCDCHVIYPYNLCWTSWEPYSIPCRGFFLFNCFLYAYFSFHFPILWRRKKKRIFQFISNDVEILVRCCKQVFIVSYHWMGNQTVIKLICICLQNMKCWIKNHHSPEEVDSSASSVEPCGLLGLFPW